MGYESNSEGISIDDGDPEQEGIPSVMQRGMSKSLQDTPRQLCKTKSDNWKTHDWSQPMAVFPQGFSRIVYFTQSF